ncbi:hypothetical protein K3495_g4481 [Podosphaera aphanis]|nr:hypothetical protein K3495_g4481 [Podosphaera aphanis]
MIPRRLLQRCAAPSSINSSVYALARSRHAARPQRSGGAVHLSTPPLLARRWYSTTPDAHAPEPAPATPADADAAREPAAATDEDPRVAELAQKTRELAEVKDRYRHAVADFRNLQDRTQRDMQAARDFALTRFAKDLIDSIDNLDRALAMVPPEKLVRPAAAAADIPAAVDDRTDLVALYEGLKMTETVLMSTLKKHGVERFDPSVAGEKFNPNEHEALFMSPVPGKEDNTVFQTQQKGFKLNGRVLRAAKVGVVKNS